MSHKTLLFAIALLMSLSCTREQAEVIKPEAVSLQGKAFFSDAKNDSLLQAFDQIIAEEPDNINFWLEKADALEAQRRFRDVIIWYKQALKQFPDSAELLKRRGQRYITVRNLDLATIDLEKAAVSHDFVLQDSLSYTENLSWAIWYYRGFVHYLRAEFEEALSDLEKSLEYSADNTSQLATLNWMHNALLRLGRAEEAVAVLDPIEEGMGYAGNYYNCILLYKGLRTAAETLDLKEAKAYELCTVGYALANLHLAKGEEEAAIPILEKITSMDTWQANGYLAAEYELSRLIKPTLRK